MTMRFNVSVLEPNHSITDQNYYSTTKNLNLSEVLRWGKKSYCEFKPQYVF